MRLYYAHGMYLYNTPQEARDIKLINALGFEIFNPNSREIQIAFVAWCEEHKEILELSNPEPHQQYMARRNYLDRIGRKEFSVMTFFEELIINGHNGSGPYGKIDGIIFRASPGGAVPGGVAKEVEVGRTIGLPILELPTFAGRQILDKEQTRQLLKELGQR